MFLPQVQYGAYVNIGGLGSVIKLMFAGILFLLLVKFSFGRKLLTKVSVQNTKELSVQIFFFPLVYCCLFVFSPVLIQYPEFFSAGFFTKKGPTQKQVADCFPSQLLNRFVVIMVE